MSDDKVLVDRKTLTALLEEIEKALGEVRQFKRENQAKR
jgi:hypothetical protein